MNKLDFRGAGTGRVHNEGHTARIDHERDLGIFAFLVGPTSAPPFWQHLRCYEQILRADQEGHDPQIVRKVASRSLETRFGHSTL